MKQFDDVESLGQPPLGSVSAGSCTIWRRITVSLPTALRLRMMAGVCVRLRSEMTGHVEFGIMARGSVGRSQEVLVPRRSEVWLLSRAMV